MVKKKADPSKNRRRKRFHIADMIIGLVVLFAALICILPFLNILATSFSNKSLAAAGEVGLWPKGFTLSAYKYILGQKALWRSMVVALERVGLGTAISLLITLLTAYPLSKESRRFKSRTFYVWFFFVTTLINGGLIPGYILIQNLRLMDSIWALVLPSSVPVFNIIVLLNFFRQLPQELEEAAFLDGAGHLRTLFQVFVPVSLPAIATITLFTITGHWNSWFDGMIYMQPENYPLGTYLQSVIVAGTSTSSGLSYEEIAAVSDKVVKAAQIIVATVPIMLVYPFLQKYFAKGLMLGSVKG